MNRQTAVDIISGRRRGAWPGLLRAGLGAAAAPYAAAMRLRRWAYRKGILKSQRAGVPVLCVGNITTGGTGKTPVTVWVVRRLKEAGGNPAILTRGYMPTAHKSESDEAELLRELCGVAVHVDPDRLAAARAAIADGADVLVMDDGFQHLRLRRDLDIVLLDATNPFGFGRCLPGGLLREPPAALRDAGAVVVTHCDEVPGGQLSELRERLGALAGGAPVHTAVHRPTKFIDEHGREFPPDSLAGRKVFAFCGLAGPEHFWATLERCGVQPAGRLALDDHVAYTQGMVQSLRREADRSGAAMCATTQKDFVKLKGLWAGEGPVEGAGEGPGPKMPLWQLAVEVEVVEGREELIGTILSAGSCR